MKYTASCERLHGKVLSINDRVSPSLMHGMGVASHGRDPGLNRGPYAMKRLLLSLGDKGLSFREALVFSADFSLPSRGQ